MSWLAVETSDVPNILKPASADLTSWIACDTVSKLKSSWDRAVYTAASFLATDLSYRECLTPFPPGFEWSDHRWTALSTGGNTPKMHWGCIWDRITQTTFGGGLGHIWLYSFSGGNSSLPWDTLKDRLLNWLLLSKRGYILIRASTGSY